MVERCPDKTEVVGPIPTTPTESITLNHFRFFTATKEGRGEKRILEASLPQAGFVNPFRRFDEIAERCVQLS